MEPLDFQGLPDGALVLIDSAPVIYFLEGHQISDRGLIPIGRRRARIGRRSKSQSVRRYDLR